LKIHELFGGGELEFGVVLFAEMLQDLGAKEMNFATVGSELHSHVDFF
jgi:hypothetical protein